LLRGGGTARTLVTFSSARFTSILTLAVGRH